ncbi:MAG: excinuclease ABC subunit UvrC, partial [Christensenellaceae bacterium]|nr:excinuclease ABC subunit UvrC [Christensenellaceae bacterium]
RSYFHASSGHSTKVKAMVAKIDDFETILCNSNYEALILECNLIKENRPFYNILLKDDKHYPFLKINTKEKFPKLKITRKKDNDDSEYFGPYIGTNAIKQVTNELAKVFPLRNCNMKFPTKLKHRPCMRYEIGLCLAPCANLCTEEEYDLIVKETISFLKGNTDKIKNNLNNQMLYYSKNLDFEKAAEYRDKLFSLNKLMDKQSAIQKRNITQDIWAVANNKKDALIYLVNVRDGKIINNDSFFLPDDGDETPTTILSSFLPQYYQNIGFVPREILLSNNTDDNESMEKMLREIEGKAVSLLVPQRGKKKSIVDISIKNAIEALTKKDLYNKLQYKKTIGSLESLSRILGLNKIPRRIEGYDISNTQGTFSVASMVVFIDGKPAKKAYRKFKIKTVIGSNDFASMNEVLTRRFTRALNEITERNEKNEPLEEGSFSDLPDLILIDGGKQQLEFANSAIKNLGFNINIFGLAKKNEEVFLLNRENPIIIDKHDPALHLIQRIRDESHRFAITYHRTIRDKSLIKSELLNIPSVGLKTQNLLFKNFKSLNGVKNATINELQNIKGISKKQAQNIYNWFNNESE